MILFFQSSTKTVLAVEAARLALLKTLKTGLVVLARQLLFNQKHWKAGT